MLRGTVLRDSLRASTTDRPTVGAVNRGLTILGHETPSTPATSWYNWRFPLKSSIKLPTDPAKGPTFEMGGPGVISYDMEQRTRAEGGYCPSGQTVTHCDDATTDDVRVAFTSQAVQDPTGDAAYYWQTNIPFDTTGRNSALFSTVKKGTTSSSACPTRPTDAPSPPSPRATPAWARPTGRASSAPPRPATRPTGRSSWTAPLPRQGRSTTRRG